METRECENIVKRTKPDGTVVEYRYKKKYNATRKNCGKTKIMQKLKACEDEQKIKLISDYIDLVLRT
jgi:hypothetical protein